MASILPANGGIGEPRPGGPCSDSQEAKRASLLDGVAKAT